MNKTVVLRVPASFRAGGGRWCLTNFSNFRIELCPPRFLFSYLPVYILKYLHIYALSTIPGLSCVVLSVLVLTVSSGLLARRYKQGKTYQIEIDKEMWVWFVFRSICDLLKVSSLNIVEKDSLTPLFVFPLPPEPRVIKCDASLCVALLLVEKVDIISINLQSTEKVGQLPIWKLGTREHGNTFLQEYLYL